MARTTGIALITAERKRQIEKEGWSRKHDRSEHPDSQLVYAAICYAAPERIYAREDTQRGPYFYDPFPRGWGDKRVDLGERQAGDALPDPDTYTREQRIDLLTKAGALIAAEIDRLLAEKPHAR